MPAGWGETKSGDGFTFLSYSLPSMPSSSQIEAAISAYLESSDGAVARSVFEWGFGTTSNGSVPETLDPSAQDGPLPYEVTGKDINLAALANAFGSVSQICDSLTFSNIGAHVNGSESEELKACSAIEKVDIPAWCFSLPDAEYQACSPAHVAAGATTAPDGRRMSINVEIIGGSLMVQHYVEDIGEPDHLRLVSHSDLFTPSGRTKIDVIWDLRVTQDRRRAPASSPTPCAAPRRRRCRTFLAHQGLAARSVPSGAPPQLRGSQPPGDARVRPQHRAARPARGDEPCPSSSPTRRSPRCW